MNKFTNKYNTLLEAFKLPQSNTLIRQYQNLYDLTEEQTEKFIKHADFVDKLKTIKFEIPVSKDPDNNYDMVGKIHKVIEKVLPKNYEIDAMNNVFWGKPMFYTKITVANRENDGTAAIVIHINQAANGKIIVDNFIYFDDVKFLNSEEVSLMDDTITDNIFNDIRSVPNIFSVK